MKIHRVIVLAQLNIDLVTIGKWHLEKGDFRNSFYVLTDDPENTQLWSYLVKDDRYRFCVWKVTDDSVLRGAYKSFSEGDLFYPGGVTYEKLGE